MLLCYGLHKHVHTVEHAEHESESEGAEISMIARIAKQRTLSLSLFHALLTLLLALTLTLDNESSLQWM